LFCFKTETLERPVDHLICNHFSRKVVREKWFEKSGSGNLVREKWLTRKKGGFIPQITFFQVGEKWLTRKKIRVCRTTFLEKWLQIKCSIESGPLCIYTTIGIDECSLGIDNTSITAKPYILQKICFQRLCSKFLVF